MKSNGRTLLVAACCLMLILSAGCAALSPITTKAEPLEERVKNYMQAQIDGKSDRAYAFLDSSSRERVTKESYVNRTKKLPFNLISRRNYNYAMPGSWISKALRISRCALVTSVRI